MAPPTRHSTRLGNNIASVAKKEDENAGASTKIPVTTRTLRGRTASSQAPSIATTKVQHAKAASATTTNVRKRILDDRTNKTTSFINSTGTTTSAKTVTKPTTRKPAATRKAVETGPMVLEDVPVNEQVKATGTRVIKPLKRPAAETASKRSSASTVTAVGKKKVNGGNVVVKVPAGPSVPSRAGAGTRRTSARSKAVERGGGDTEERAAKKARTSEPDHHPTEKENVELKEEEDQQQDVGVVVRAKGGKKKVVVQMESLKVGEEGWEDLDEGDEDDPLMVKEYVTEIYLYMRQLELETLPDPEYMSRQNELTWKMRGVLVDWIIEVHSKFRLLPETLYLAINLMDRFLSKRTVALIKFQLVGVTALFLAAKYEEVICPSVTNFLYMTDGGYDNEEILKAETYMLEMLEWDLRYPNPLNFLRRISKADHYDIQSRTFAKYFMEISVVDYRLVSTVPSLLSASSIWLARKLLKRGPWDPNLVHYSGYTEQELLPTAQIMVDYILRCGCKGLGMGLEPGFVGVLGYEGGNEHGNLFKKYSTRKFFRVSELVRDWAIDLYTFETPTGWEWDKLEEWTD